MKRHTKYETVTKNRHKSVARLRNNGCVQYHGKLFHKSVANCDRWPTYRNGQFNRFCCSLLNIAVYINPLWCRVGTPSRCWWGFWIKSRK